MRGAEARGVGWGACPALAAGRGLGEGCGGGGVGERVGAACIAAFAAASPDKVDSWSAAT